ncbi:arginine N-succinyltransferase [Legionella pneumophila]|nr:arginine N-succinyltransferase [Legionella pneumophila]
MMLFRSARDSDLDAIHQLAEISGVGMTTLPKDKELLKKRLEWSCESYQRNVTNPGCDIIFLSWKNKK